MRAFRWFMEAMGVLFLATSFYKVLMYSGWTYDNSVQCAGFAATLLSAAVAMGEATAEGIKL